MAVNVEIKSNAGLAAELTIPQLAKLRGLSYGVSDNHCCLKENEIGKYTILYDSACIGRGFEISFEEESVCLRLSLPTTPYEIKLFYELISDICKKAGVTSFVRDEEVVPVEYASAYVEPDMNASLDAIKNIDQKIRDSEYANMMIFGARNPISLGAKEMDEINCSLEGLEKFLNRIQQKDVFYANPVFYQRQDGSIFGVYFVGEAIVSVVPTVPYVLFNSIENVDSWYVRIPDQNSIPYGDFINHVDKLEDYDNNHVIVSLSEEKIYELASEYAVNMNTKQPVKGNYWGSILDNGRNHLNKIRSMELNVEELAAFNHLAVFLRWAFEHDLLSERLLTVIPELSKMIAEKSTDLRMIIVQNPVFNCEIRATHFNEQGKIFAKKFYKYGKNGYPACVDQYTETVLGTEKYNCKEYKNEAYLFVPYNEEYYQGLSAYIEDAWQKFVEK